MSDRDAADQEVAAQIIPRDQHCVSRKNISQAALKVLYRLHESGFAAFLVGGAVRDLLLGIQPKDFDIATDATPEQVKRLFRNCRLIGRRFRLAHVIFGREIIEVATFRGSSDDADGNRRQSVDGRIVRDNVWGSIEEDAIRRDFRVNAMYYDIADFSVRDYVHGMADLERRVLRLIGDPETRYQEDPVRMLRAARLAAKLDFVIGPEAAAPLGRLGDLLDGAPPARLFDESLKLFLSGHGLQSLRLLREHDLLKHLFPATAKALAHDPDGHYLDLLERGLANTDRRIAEDKSVTPAFLFALLLWGEVRHRAEKAIGAGENVALAWQEASAAVIREQSQRVAIPRRFVYAMEEIWALQLRFDDRRKKRVMRLLEHPRFRAAYDFLLMRSGESPEIAEAGEWWTKAQELPRDALVSELEPEKRAPSGNRRRRRRRKPKTTAGGDSD
ncbi:MAG: polynucleotide adenylyltransferase PcnB [Rhodanobacteraceae bacterium]